MAAELPASARALLAAAERAWRVQFAARALECASAGALAGAGVMLAGALSDSLADSLAGAAPAPGLAPLAWCAAGFASATLWLERAPRRAALARTADRRLGLAGALATALDEARAPRPSPLLELLARRVSARGPKGSPARALLASAAPRPLYVLAPLLLAGALLALAAEARSAAGSATHDEQAARTRAAALATLEAAAGEAGAQSELDEPDAQALLHAVRTLASTPAEAWPERAAELARELALAARALEPGSPARARLERTAGELARAAAGEAGSARPDAGAGRTPGLVPRGPGDTMPGSLTSDTAEPAGPPGAAGPPGSTGAARGLRWWPARHDPVVERWLSP